MEGFTEIINSVKLILLSEHPELVLVLLIVVTMFYSLKNCCLNVNLIRCFIPTGTTVISKFKYS